MKRVGNLYEQIISFENLEASELNARKGKLKQYGVLQFDKNKDYNLQMLHEILKLLIVRTVYQLEII